MFKTIKRLCLPIITLSFILPCIGNLYVYADEAKNVTKWDLTNITDAIEYNEADFQSGITYEYDGLILTGNSSKATITSEGVYLGKVNTTNPGEMNVAFTPNYDGILKITIKEASKQPLIYADTSLGVRTNLIVDSGTEGETAVEAGKTYYIYNGT